MISLIIIACISYSTAESRNRLNYGTFLAQTRPVILQKDYWLHSYHVKLPDIPTYQDTEIENCNETTANYFQRASEEKISFVKFYRSVGAIMAEEFCDKISNSINTTNQIRAQIRDLGQQATERIKQLIPTQTDQFRVSE